MQFRLLGELEVLCGERLIRIRGPRLRSLFACLLVHRNETLSHDVLLEALWGGRPPPSAGHDLEALVSRLRRTLGAEAASRIETTPGGYRLCVAPEELDAGRFEQLLAAGRQALADGDNEAAIGQLRNGLDEWRGDPFAELIYEPCLAEEAARLEELRSGALEAIFEAQLRSGGHQEAISGLEALMAGEPLREHVRAQLMRALYRSGRQVEALEVYRAGYELLAEQGLEPGTELRLVQEEILQQDPELLSAEQDAVDPPDTRYARNGGVAIAYQVSGEGPYDVVYAPPFVTNVELTWHVPSWAALLRRLGSFSRLIRFDKRGTGMSDRADPGEYETGVEDIRAVMDAAVSEQAAIIGASQAGPLAVLFAAAHPERVWALVLWGTTARVAWAEDYPFGLPASELERIVAESERIWTEPGYAEARARAIGATDVPELASLWRQSATPGVVRALARRYFRVDVRDALARIQAPTLVLNREGDNEASAGCRYLGDHIPGARHVVLPGSHNVMFAAGDIEPIVHEIKEFLDGAWEQHTRDPYASLVVS